MSKYLEDSQVEQPAIDLFDDLGWETINACDEELASGTTQPGLWRKNNGLIVDYMGVSRYLQ